MTVVGLSAPVPVALAFSNINHVVATLDQAMDVVDTVTDEDQLCDLWHAMDAIGSKAWQVRAKISYVIVEGTPSVQGQSDVDGRGREAVLGRWAARLGCSSRTLWEDWRIFRTTLAPLLSETFAESSGASAIMGALTDRGFYQAASRSSDPVACLEEFARRKDDNPFFDVGDVKREMHGASGDVVQVHLSDLARAAHDLWARLGPAGIDELIAELLKVSAGKVGEQ